MVLEAGLGPAVFTALLAALVAAAGTDGTVTLTGNQPTVSVLWFWPLHSLSSRLRRKGVSQLTQKGSTN